MLVVRMTTGGFAAPFRVAYVFQRQDALLLPDQMHAIDRTRAVKRLGRIDRDTLSQTLAILREMFVE